MRKKSLVLTLVLGLAVTSFGQSDKHFTMFAESPVYLNPATAGFFPGNMQVFTNTRFQWTTVSNMPFRTISGSADWRMFDNGSFLGAGVNFYNDLAGESQYMTNEVTIPINYAIQIAQDNHFAIGLQPAWYQRTMLNQSVTWDNQWTGVDFNTAMPSGELIANQNLDVSRFDISAGAYWYAHLSKKTRLAFGVAGHHLTKQKVNFLGSDNKLYRKLTLHGQGEFALENSNLTIMPAFFGFIQGPNKELTIGSNFKHQLRGASRHTGYFEQVTMSWGIYYRLGDALLANIIFDISGFGIGAGYDLNISGLTVASYGVGGFEMFLRYRFRFGNRGLGNPSIH